MRVLIYIHGERAEFEWVNNWTTFIVNLTKLTDLECSLRFSKDIFLTNDSIKDVDIVFLMKNNIVFNMDVFKTMIDNVQDHAVSSSLRIGNTMDTVFGIKDKDDKNFISRENVEFFLKENKESKIKHLKVFRTHYDFTIIQSETIKHVLDKPFDQWDNIFDEAMVSKYIDTSIYTPVHTNIVI